MDDARFSTTFLFRTFTFGPRHHANNRAGTDRHFVGFLRRGSARFITETGEVSVRAGEAFYIPSGCRYESCWTDEESVCFDSFGFQLLPGTGAVRYPLQVLPADGEILSLLEELHSHQTVDCRSVGALYRLLGLSLPRMTRLPSCRRAALVEEAARYMTGHWDCTALELSRHLGVSVSGLYAAFQYAGTTPVEMKHRLQAERAEILLTTTDLSVEEIAAALGFSSSAYFRKVFSAVTGKTPRQTRRERAF